MKFDIKFEAIDEKEFVVARTLEVLSDEEYDKMKPVIESMGGHWRERVKGFVFSKESMKRNNYSEWQESIQFFPTPIEVAKRMAELIGILEYTGTVRLLEPSAGQGGLLKCLPREILDNADTIEPSKENADVLRSMGLNPFEITFEEYYEDRKAKEKEFTHILMNPPFSLGRDVNHVMMAYDLLKNGGLMAAVISENTLYYEKNANKDFVKWLEEKQAVIEPIPYGSFIDSGTSIDTVLLVIRKS